MTQNTIFTAEALTLENLRDRIKEAIVMVGEDAEWIGFSDGSIHIWIDENGPILCIEPTPIRFPRKTTTEESK